MELFLISFHVVLSVLLVLVILMQPGKGADVSSAFGGGASSQLFGAAGPGNFLTRGTSIIGALFMVTSVALALNTKAKHQRGGGAADDVGTVQGAGGQGSGFGVTVPGGQPPPDGVISPAPEAPGTVPGSTPAPGPAPEPGLAPPPGAAPPAEGGATVPPAEGGGTTPPTGGTP